MLKTATVLLGSPRAYPNEFHGDVIGVDYGAYVLAQHHIHMKLALGDFDSVDQTQFETIISYSDEIIRLDPIKDESDSEVALKLCVERGYQEIHVWGALGSRQDHAYVNILLAKRFPQVILADDYNLICTLTRGQKTLSKSDYRYFSVFALEESVLSLEGFKYPLIKERFNEQTTLGLSNEISEKKALITVHQGKVLIIQSNDTPKQ